MTTNATVEARHKDMAAKAAEYLSWKHANQMGAAAAREFPGILAHAQALANLEAANGMLEGVCRIAGDEGRSYQKRLNAIANLASGHTPSPCPSCAAKDEAMEAMRADLVEIDGLLTNAPDSPSVIADAKAIAARYRPPADPVVEAIREMALTDATQDDAERLRKALASRGLEITELSRLGGAK